MGIDEMSELAESIESRVKAIAERVAAYEGLEIVEVSWMSSGKGSLRIFVDKEGGVGIDDCVSVSRQVSTILDAEDVVNKILSLFENKHKLREMGNNAREKVVRYYNWERVADATLEIFRSFQPQH